MTVKVETNTDYMEFLDNKRAIVKPSGFTPGELNPMLFPFQAAVVRWALQRGKSALFEDCGLGKTPQQLEWAHQVYLHTAECPYSGPARRYKTDTRRGCKVWD